MKRTIPCILSIVSFFLVLVGYSSAQQFNFVSIDAPCSAAPPTNCPNGIAPRTFVNGINPRGDIVGAFFDGAGGRHGFLLSQGLFTTIDFPGGVRTNAGGISPSGQIVGNYTVPFNPRVTDSVPQDSPIYCPAAGSLACVKGFLFEDGKFSTVLFPGHPGAIPHGITPEGDIYGCLHDFDVMNSMFGAAWTHSGPLSLMSGGGELRDPTQSVPISMNNGSTSDGRMIVGLWGDPSIHEHGFVVQDGVFQSYDVPGSILTEIWGINPEHQFVGTYVDSSGLRHGFLQLPNGSSPVNVDYPGAAATLAFGINPEGVIVGQYFVGGVSHGFVAVPCRGASRKCN